MGDPRVTERDNPLVRRLNAVARANEEMGTALGGGARPPRAPLGPVQGGTATVLPPPAVPLTSEEALGDALPPAEAEELERRWATDPSNPANRTTLVASPDGAIEHVPIQEPAPPTRLYRRGGSAGYLQLIDDLPLSEEQKQTVRAWVFEGAAKQIMTETARRLDEMQIAFGLAPKETKEDEHPGGATEVQNGLGTALAGGESREIPREGSTVAGSGPGTGTGEIPKVRAKSRRGRKGSKVQGGTGA